MIARIQTHAKTKRIRVSEFFRDFDKLRSYSIRKDDFMRGFTFIGIDLNNDELECLCEYYSDPKRKGFCRWKDFDQDIEKVFTEPHLETKPTFVHQAETKESPFVVKNNKMSPYEEQVLQRTLENIREHLRIRQSSVKPFFRDFDRLCSGTGHVTKSQFRRCFTYMKYDVTDEEFNILCKRWTKADIAEQPAHSASNDQYHYIKDVSECICYILFLEELEDGMQKDSFEPPTLEQEPSLLVKPTKPASNSSLNELAYEKLMMKIKIKVNLINLDQN